MEKLHYELTIHDQCMYLGSMYLKGMSLMCKVGIWNHIFEAISQEENYSDITRITSLTPLWAVFPVN